MKILQVEINYFSGNKVRVVKQWKHIKMKDSAFKINKPRELSFGSQKEKSAVLIFAMWATLVFIYFTISNLHRTFSKRMDEQYLDKTF